MTLRAMALLIAAFGALTGPSTAQAQQGGVVTMNGRVGSVQIGKSTAAQVRSKIGKPSSSTRVQTSASSTKYLQLTYGCGGGKRSLFFFDGKGRLSNFISTCQSWHTPAGTSVGDDYDTAVDAEERDAQQVGCGDGVAITKRGRATLHITFPGEGADVEVIAIEGSNNVLGC